MAIVVKLTCKLHPEYKGMRPPVADCKACRQIFNYNTPIRVDRENADGSIIQTEVVTAAHEINEHLVSGMLHKVVDIGEYRKNRSNRPPKTAA